MKNTTVVIVSSHSSLESGGVGTHLDILIKNVHRNSKITPYVVLGTRGLKQIISFKLSKLISRIIPTYSDLSTIFIRILLLKKEIEKIVDNADDERIVIHAHDRYAAVAGCLCKAHRNDMTVIQTLHAPFSDQFYVDGLPSAILDHFIRYIDAAAVKKIDKYIAVDELQKKLLVEYFPSESSGKDIHIISNAVEQSLFDFPQKKKLKTNTLVIARHLQKKNGVDSILRAIAMCESKQKIQAHIIGDGPERHTIENLIKELNLEAVVILKGRLPRAQTLVEINNAFASVVPSVPVGNYIEATSLTMLETLALRTPLIASNIGGIRQVLSGNNAAILCEPGNYVELSNAIDTVFEGRKGENIQVDNGYNLVKANYGEDIWFQKIISVYGVV